MIGRTGPVNRMHTIRWARTQAQDPRLTPLAAHLLVILATYCNEYTVCFPSRDRLAKDVKRKRRQVHEAMRLLEDLELVCSKQRGHGHTATRELLFNPAKDSLDTPAMRAEAVRPTALLERSGNATAVRLSAPSGAAHRTHKSQGSAKGTGSSRVSGPSNEKSQGSSAAGRTASSPTATTNNNNGNDGGSAGEHAAVRAAIRDSLASVDRLDDPIDALRASPCNCEKPDADPDEDGDLQCGKCGRAA